MAANAINGGKVADDSLAGSDILEASLARVPRAADANTVQGRDASSLGPDATWSSTNPSPDTALATQPAETTVLSKTVKITRAWVPLIMASFDLYSTDASAQATCRVYVDGTAKGQRAIADFHAVNDNEQVAMIALSGFKLTGTASIYTNSDVNIEVEVRCNEDFGSVHFERGDLTVVALPI